MPKKRTARLQKIFVREWRKHRGLTLMALADRIGMTFGLVSMVERGTRGYTQDTLERLASALNTDVGSLLTRDPTDPNDIGWLWDHAKPAQRKRIAEAARKIVRADR